MTDGHFAIIFVIAGVLGLFGLIPWRIEGRGTALFIRRYRGRLTAYLLICIATWGYLTNKPCPADYKTYQCRTGDVLAALAWPVFVPARMSKYLWRAHWFEGLGDD